MDALEKKIGYSFRDKSLLKTALTHSSYANENKGASGSNERLEFLGDSVLGMMVARHLYLNFDGMPEGGMTRLRSELVCEQSLYDAAARIGFGRHIRLGKGEELSGGRNRASILADAFEAVLAAIYLDGGEEAARRFVEANILSGLDSQDTERNSDYKTALQELVQQKSGMILGYEMISESGPDHNKLFTAQVALNDRPIGTGSGRTKKEAEQSAAKSALEGLTR